MNFPKILAKYALVASLSCALSYLLMSWLGAPVGGFMEDDSWFYAQIAYNWPRLGFPSFDGVHETSGFHLAWGALLALVAGILSLLTDSKLVFASTLTALYITVLWACAEVISRGARPRWTYQLIALTVLSLGAFYMETAPLSLLLVGLLAWLSAHPDETLRTRIVTMALSAACVLCRIDALLIFAVWTAAARRQGSSKALVFGAALGALVHFAAMQLLFGHGYSVSSLLKSGGIFSSAQLAELALPKIGILVRCVVWLLLTAWATSQLRKSQHPHAAGALLGTGLFTTAHLCLSDIRSWYFLPGCAVALYLAIQSRPERHAERGVSPHPASWQYLALAMSVALLGYKAFQLLSHERERVRAWGFVTELTRRVPAEARVYEIDASGFPGFWSERAIINGDGLVNTYAYATQLRQDDLGSYLQDERICWLLTTARMVPKQGPHLLDYHGLKLQLADVIPVFPADPKGYRKRTQLWKLSRPDCSPGPPIAGQVK